MTTTPDAVERLLREARTDAPADVVEVMAEGLWAASRRKMGLRPEYLPKGRSDFRKLAGTKLEALVKTEPRVDAGLKDTG